MAGAKMSFRSEVTMRRSKFDSPWARRSSAISVALRDAIAQRKGSLTCREAAAQAEISTATFNRVERGYMPDIVTFSKLCVWLGRSPGELIFQQHDDDTAVDRFAAAMKLKLAAKRADARGGWDDPEVCSVNWLNLQMLQHCSKGDPVDVGNFAMMVWNRENCAK